MLLVFNQGYMFTYRSMFEGSEAFSFSWQHIHALLHLMLCDAPECLTLAGGVGVSLCQCTCFDDGWLSN